MVSEERRGCEEEAAEVEKRGAEGGRSTDAGAHRGERRHARSPRMRRAS